jgi:hypothetical protein
MQQQPSCHPFQDTSLSLTPPLSPSLPACLSPTTPSPHSLPSSLPPTAQPCNHPSIPLGHSPQAPSTFQRGAAATAYAEAPQLAMLMQ